MNIYEIEYDYIYEEDDAPDIDFETPAKNANSRESLLPLFICDIIRDTTRFHKMTQVKLLSRLEEYPYDLGVSRQTLSRALQTLANEHIGIHVSREGVWYESITFPQAA